MVSGVERRNAACTDEHTECARNEVLARLAHLDVDQLYIADNKHSIERPDGPHVSILTTSLEKLREKKDVIIVFNEHMQDLGIWAYRILMREGGIEKGSAVGLARKLHQNTGASVDADALEKHMLALDVADDDAPKRADSVATVPSPKGRLTLDTNILHPVGHGHNATAQCYAEEQADSENFSGSPQPTPPADDYNFTPGLIILNAGQLIYSNQLNKSMGQHTWLARQKRNAVDDSIRIDPEYNRVQGHHSVDEHVKSIMEAIVPSIVAEEARIFLVGLSEGGEAIIKWLDKKLTAADRSGSFIGDRLAAVALTQPTHMHAELKSPALVQFLASSGRSWIISQEPKGKMLAFPEAVKPTLDYAPPAVEETDGQVASTPTKPKDTSIVVTEPETEEEEVDWYANEVVSCVTLSSGESQYTECIFPNIVDDVLAFFKEISVHSAGSKVLEEGDAHSGFA